MMPRSRCRKVRTNLGLTQEGMALVLGTSQQRVSHYETGFRKPGKQTRRLYAALEVIAERELLGKLAIVINEYDKEGKNS